jgi:DNA-binding response OmpR family regulator
MVEERRSILIVDDEEEICDFLVFEFHTRGWRAEFALDGESAWEKINRDPVDVVLSDVRMPVVDGFALLERVRGMPVQPAFLLVTGFSEIDDDAARAIGADGIVIKPFDVEELVRTLGRCLAGRAAVGGVQ